MGSSAVADMTRGSVIEELDRDIQGVEIFLYKR